MYFTIIWYQFWSQYQSTHVHVVSSFYCIVRSNSGDLLLLLNTRSHRENARNSTFFQIFWKEYFTSEFTAPCPINLPPPSNTHTHTHTHTHTRTHAAHWINLGFAPVDVVKPHYGFFSKIVSHEVYWQRQRTLCARHNFQRSDVIIALAMFSNIIRQLIIYPWGKHGLKFTWIEQHSVSTILELIRPDHV